MAGAFMASPKESKGVVETGISEDARQLLIGAQKRLIDASHEIANMPPILRISIEKRIDALLEQANSLAKNQKTSKTDFAVFMLQYDSFGKVFEAAKDYANGLNRAEAKMVELIKGLRQFDRDLSKKMSREERLAKREEIENVITTLEGYRKNFVMYGNLGLDELFRVSGNEVAMTDKFKAGYSIVQQANGFDLGITKAVLMLDYDDPNQYHTFMYGSRGLEYLKTAFEYRVKNEMDGIKSNTSISASDKKDLLKQYQTTLNWLSAGGIMEAQKHYIAARKDLKDALNPTDYTSLIKLTGIGILAIGGAVLAGPPGFFGALAIGFGTLGAEQMYNGIRAGNYKQTGEGALMLFTSAVGAGQVSGMITYTTKTVQWAVGGTSAYFVTSMAVSSADLLAQGFANGFTKQQWVQLAEMGLAGVGFGMAGKAFSEGVTPSRSAGTPKASEVIPKPVGQRVKKGSTPKLVSEPERLGEPMRPVRKTAPSEAEPGLLTRLAGRSKDFDKLDEPGGLGNANRSPPMQMAARRRPLRDTHNVEAVDIETEISQIKKDANSLVTDLERVYARGGARSQAPEFELELDGARALSAKINALEEAWNRLNTNKTAIPESAAKSLNLNSLLRQVALELKRARIAMGRLDTTVDTTAEISAIDTNLTKVEGLLRPALDAAGQRGWFQRKWDWLVPEEGVWGQRGRSLLRAGGWLTTRLVIPAAVLSIGYYSIRDSPMENATEGGGYDDTAIAISVPKGNEKPDLEDVGEIKFGRWNLTSGKAVRDTIERLDSVLYDYKGERKLDGTRPFRGTWAEVQLKGANEESERDIVSDTTLPKELRNMINLLLLTPQDEEGKVKVTGEINRLLDLHARLSGLALADKNLKVLDKLLNSGLVDASDITKLTETNDKLEALVTMMVRLSPKVQRDTQVATWLNQNVANLQTVSDCLIKLTGAGESDAVELVYKLMTDGRVNQAQYNSYLQVLVDAHEGKYLPAFRYLNEKAKTESDAKWELADVIIAFDNVIRPAVDQSIRDREFARLTADADKGQRYVDVHLKPLMDGKKLVQLERVYPGRVVGNTTTDFGTLSHPEYLVYSSVASTTQNITNVELDRVIGTWENSLIPGGKFSVPAYASLSQYKDEILNLAKSELSGTAISETDAWTKIQKLCNALLNEKQITPDKIRQVWGTL